MYKYGQYCPVAKALEIVGDRWTLLIVRDLLTGTCHFNDLERGLPGISRGLLAERLRRLQQMGLVEKVMRPNHHRSTAYYLTAAGQELHMVIDSLMTWGARWAFGDPEDGDLDPVLLMWWMRNNVCVEQLPARRIVVRFDFKGTKEESFWLLLTREDVSICLTDPGFDLNVLVTADLAAFFQIWLGRLSWSDACRDGQVQIEAIPALAEAFPGWFTYSAAAPSVRAATAARRG